MNVESNGLKDVKFDVNLNFTEIDKVMVPLELLDPVSQAIMTNPVIIYPSGNTYDQTTVDKILEKEICPKDPITRQLIQSTSPNRAIKDSIERFLNQNPSLKPKENEVSESNSMSKTLKDLKLENIKKYTANQFMALFNDVDEITFPADQEIRIYDVNKKLSYIALRDLKNTKCRLDILNDIFLPIAKKIKLMESKGSLSFDLLLTDDVRDSFTSFISTKEIKITLVCNDIQTKISTLLDRMNRANVEILNIRPNQPLVLLLSEKNKKYVLENDQCKRIADLFSLKLPKEFIGVEIRIGNCKLIPTIKHFPNAIALVGENGISIRLKRKI